MNEQAIREIVDNFKKYKWDSHPMERTLELVISTPQSAVELLKLALDEMPQGGTFLDAAISFMPITAFAELTILALEKLRKNQKNRLAEDIIHYCSLQSVQTLHPYLDIIFELGLNSDASWAWRESGKQHFSYLRNVFENDRDKERRFRAWNAMIETREPEVLQFAMSQAHQIDMSEKCEAYLLSAGFEFSESGLRKLYTDSVYHVFFPSNYLLPEQAPLIRWRNLFRQHHPTWKPLDLASPKMRFGGQSDGVCIGCGEELHHLITLEPIPSTIEITNMNRLELATCLSCLGWERTPLFYKHSWNGQPRQIEFNVERKTPKFPATALKQVQVQIAQISSRWLWQDDASSNGRENLHRVGGNPCWIQNPEYPFCPECNSRMIFLSQISSYLPTVDNSEWMWGDAGICYIFWCDMCKISGYWWQCY
jgi:hypothetical protein